MLVRIAKHEWRTLAADATPWCVLLVFVLAIGYGVQNGVRWVAFQRESIAQALDEQTTRFDTLKTQLREIEAGTREAPFTSPQAPDAAGSRLGLKYAVLPPSPLAPLSIGQSDVLPYYFKVSTASRESILTAGEIENPHRLLSGRFDLSFVIIYLYPLLILALSYNLISQEKEQGTLAMLLAQPVSLATFVAGKIVLRAILFLATVVLFSMVGLAVAGVDLGAENGLARLALWIGIVAAYGAFWFGAVLLVTSFGKSSATNALALAGIWLLLVVVAPSTLNLVATTLYAMPSRVELVTALRAASNEASSRGSALLARYYEDHPELAALPDAERAMNDFTVTRLAVDEEIERSVRPVVDKYDIQLRNQQALVDRFRFLSPAIIAQDALNDIAGTGSARHRHFVTLVEDFHARWRDYFLPQIVQKVKLTAASYDEFPVFEFRDEPLSAVAVRSGVGLLMLLAGAGVLAVLGYRRLNSYPITA
jgi:ABC-2 type transport system permease protein